MANVCPLVCNTLALCSIALALKLAKLVERKSSLNESFNLTDDEGEGEGDAIIDLLGDERLNR